MPPSDSQTVYSSEVPFKELFNQQLLRPWHVSYHHLTMIKREIIDSDDRVMTTRKGLENLPTFSWPQIPFYCNVIVMIIILTIIAFVIVRHFHKGFLGRSFLPWCWFRLKCSRHLGNHLGKWANLLMTRRQNIIKLIQLNIRNNYADTAACNDGDDDDDESLNCIYMGAHCHR